MRERSSGKITITVSRAELVMLQDALDDAIGGSWHNQRAYYALGRRLHALTGEELPPSWPRRRRRIPAGSEPITAARVSR